MELIKNHIYNHLREFVNEQTPFFSEVFHCIQNEDMADYELILNYLDKILNNNYSEKTHELKIQHIHFENDFDNSIKSLIAEYLLIRNFKHNHLNDLFYDEINSELINFKNSLRAKIRMLSSCPDGASGKNGGNRIFKNWLNQKDAIKAKLEFYQDINENKHLGIKTVFNCLGKEKSKLIEHFTLKPFAIDIESFETEKSYCLLNTEKGLNEIDEIENLLDTIESVILFDCDRKKLMSNFSLEEINKWNSEFGTKFKQYLILTFGEEVQSFNSIRNKIDIIRERFKIPIGKTYTILTPEINSLLSREQKNSIPIDLVGFETSSFWDSFLLETSIRELYELRSIKLMNIYSLCLTEEIKNYILDDLFSKNESSDLVTINTKQALLELRYDDVNVIKEALSNTLDLIINLKIIFKINQQLNDVASIVFDEAIIGNSKLISKFTKAFDLRKSIKINTWSALTSDTTSNILILSYRDQGKYPNYYYPNLIEFECQNETIAKAILPNLFFAHYYKWSKYSLLKDYHKYLSHPIRQNYFEWNNLNNSIQALRPESKLNINWNLENEFSSSDQKEVYKIKTKNQRSKIYHGSDLIIFSEVGNKRPRIERIKWAFDNLDFNECVYKTQKLDDLLAEFNPAEKLIDTTQQEVELKIIKKQLGLENESAGRLWKVLLKRKSDSIGVEAVYEELKMIFEKSNTSIISINHFQNSWINVDSDSFMPRGNKNFKVLCDYLELKNNYRLIMYSLKNVSISGKIEATKKYSKLLKDLFSDCCFDDGVSEEEKLKSKINYYRNNHILDELGIDNENPLNGLLTLIELVKPEIKLLELESIEKIEQ